MVVELVELFVESAFELIRRTVEGLIYVAAMVRHNRRRAPLHAGFHGAALVVPATFGTVFVAQMNFDPSDACGKTAQHVGHDFLYVGYQFLATFDVLVRVDLNLHGIFLGCHHTFGVATSRVFVAELSPKAEKLRFEEARFLSVPTQKP